MPLLSQARRLLPFLTVLYALPLLLLTAVAAVSFQTGLPAYKFMRDPAQIADVHPFMGFVSNVGALLWCATAAICLFASLLLGHRGQQAHHARFFFYAGLFTLLLMADDFFVLHDRILPFYLGVTEKPVFGIYAALLALGFFFFGRIIAAMDYLLLLIALGFFALSVVGDEGQFVVQRAIGHWRILIEDGFKFLGIVGWFGFFVRSCFAQIRLLNRTQQ